MKIIRHLPLICLILASAVGAAFSVPALGSSTGKAAAIDEASLAGFIDAAPGPIHSVLVAFGGELVFEHYRPGEDQPWGKPRGIYAYDAGTLHDMRSISKSVVSLLVGMAVDRGEIDIDRPAFDYLPDYADLKTPDKAGITVRNLLAMDSGFVANEMVAYAVANNTERLMNVSADPVRYALGRPLIAMPGSKWVYDGGNTMVLAKILRQLTGLDLLPLAQRDLFEPLGIRTSEWMRLRASGEYAAQGGLRLRPRDLLKLGELLLNDGRWNERRIVSSDWLRLSTAPVHEAWYSERYCLHWWSGTTVMPGGRVVAWKEALGLGGQRLYVIGDFGLVVVMNAGLYDRPERDREAGP